MKSYYTIERKHEPLLDNGISLASVFNSKSGKSHVGFIHPNGKVEILVGARFKTVEVTHA